MSFGFSAGDFISGANIAFKLGKAFSDSRGSAKEYQQLIRELNVVHKVLLQVEQLRVSNQLAQATVNALLFLVNSANEAMEVFILDYEHYGRSLRQGGSGNAIRDSWRKGKWAFQMPMEVV